MEQETKSFYRKYKNVIIIVTFLVASMIVGSQVIMRQFEEMQTNRALIEVEEKKIKTLQGSIDVLAKIKNEDLDEYFELAEDSLPQIKNILLIYNDIVASTQTLFTTNNFYFGARHNNDGTGATDKMNNSNSSLQPVFYQMRVYNKVLSSTERTQNYDAVKSTYGI